MTCMHIHEHGPCHTHEHEPAHMCMCMCPVSDGGAPVREGTGLNKHAPPFLADAPQCFGWATLWPCWPPQRRSLERRSSAWPRQRCAYPGVCCRTYRPYLVWTCLACRRSLAWTPALSSARWTPIASSECSRPCTATTTRPRRARPCGSPLSPSRTPGPAGPPGLSHRLASPRASLAVPVGAQATHRQHDDGGGIGPGLRRVIAHRAARRVLVPEQLGRERPVVHGLPRHRRPRGDPGHGTRRLAPTGRHARGDAAPPRVERPGPASRCAPCRVRPMPHGPPGSP